MKKIRHTIFTVLVLSISTLSYGTTRDSVVTNKMNLIELEFLGNNYLSPFNYFLASEYGISPFSLNYSRTIIQKKFCWQFKIGISAFHSAYSETINHQYVYPYVYRKVWPVCIPLGFLWRPNYKRNGLWVGLSYCAAFGRQQYVIHPDNQSSVIVDANFDYQIIPNVCYQFRSKDERLVCKISFTPKISSALFSKEAGYEWTILPLWGGISIGGGW